MNPWQDEQHPGKTNNIPCLDYLYPQIIQTFICIPIYSNGSVFPLSWKPGKFNPHMVTRGRALNGRVWQMARVSIGLRPFPVWGWQLETLKTGTVGGQLVLLKNMKCCMPDIRPNIWIWNPKVEPYKLYDWTGNPWPVKALNLSALFFRSTRNGWHINRFQMNHDPMPVSYKQTDQDSLM